MSRRIPDDVRQRREAALRNLEANRRRTDDGEAELGRHRFTVCIYEFENERDLPVRSYVAREVRGIDLDLAEWVRSEGFDPRDGIPCSVRVGFTAPSLERLPPGAILTGFGPAPVMPRHAAPVEPADDLRPRRRMRL